MSAYVHIYTACFTEIKENVPAFELHENLW